MNGFLLLWVIFQFFSSLCFFRVKTSSNIFARHKIMPQDKKFVKYFVLSGLPFLYTTYMYFDLSLSKIWCKNWKQVEMSQTGKKKIDEVKITCSILIKFSIHIWSSKVRIQVCISQMYYIPVVERNSLLHLK